MTDFVRRRELDGIADECVVLHQAAPCAQVACAYRGANGWRIDVGVSGRLGPNDLQADTDTLFDLASVTKPFSALTLARLVRSRLLDWDTPLGVPLRDVHGTPSARVPLAWLAAHRSGLDGHRPLYAPLQSGRKVDRFQALRVAGNARRDDCGDQAPEQGFDACYSDLGYLLLGEAMARAAGVPLDTLIRREVSALLGLDVRSARQWRKVKGSFDQRVAPTEVVDWRGGVVRGFVHDENAWAMSGEGCSAHAGLFGAAHDVAALGIAVVEACAGLRDDWLTAQQIEPLVRPRPDTTWRAGFDGKSASGSSAGECCSSETFGHLGFTGTSLWIDPASHVVVVLLTNRVHPKRDRLAIKKVRPIVHDALFSWGQQHCGRLQFKDNEALQ